MRGSVSLPPSIFGPWVIADSLLDYKGPPESDALD
jgi:hypothetical protein